MQRIRLLPLVSIFCVMAASYAQVPPSAEMVKMSGGDFVMGTDEAAIDALMARFQVKRRELFSSEAPAQRIHVAPFLIDRTEVTNAAFRKWSGASSQQNESDLPATFITWDQAVAYCQSVAKRLPSEAEWEFAASNGGKTEFPWGDEMPNAMLANWSGTKFDRPVRVGSFPPSPAGIYDLAGNVWEFVQDVWPGDPSRRVIRGGSYGGSPVNLRARFRDSHPAQSPGPHVGFRCAR
jgi:formylglycine-generating enzyme required for sulfatase activity